MTLRQAGLLAPALVAAGLAGCGPSAKERSELLAACPQAMRVQDATILTRFKPGTGRDRTDVLFQAEVGKVSIACKPRSNRVDVDLTMEILVAEGPALKERVANVGYFVRLLDAYGNIVQGANFNADYRFSGNRTREASSEQIAVNIPLAEGQAGGAFVLAVGLLPTPEELDYNRRGGGR